MFNIRSALLKFYNKMGSIMLGINDNSSDYALVHNSLDNVNAVNQSQGHWRKCRSQDSRFIESIYMDIVSLCEIDNQTRVADIGCGTGVLVDKLSREFSSSRVTGYDFAEQKVAQCLRYYKTSNFLVRSVYEDLDQNYDVITLTEVLEHLERPGKAVQNCFNHLNSNGRMFFTVPNGRVDTYIGHINFWSPESWLIFINDCMSEVAGVDSIKTGLIKGRNYALVRRG